jgi:Flp pilus assembly protein TadD
MTKPDVTICIPAWQAEAFIARTLDCASTQTHSDVRILVSIDRSDDDTESICRAAAEQDRRIEVISQPERLGWSENVNALLRRVDTPYFFLYFHDDIIEPDYTETLLQVLRQDPGAMSAHCDLEKFDRQQHIERGTDYRGSAATRLMTYLSEEVKGPLLRGLIRSEVIAQGLCFPPIAGNGNWRVPPFAMRLLAAGPARYIPRILYRRWMREGSMTTQWQPDSREALVEGQRACTELCLGIIDGIDAGEAQKAAVRFCLYVRMMNRTRRAERRLGRDQLIQPAELSPAFEGITMPVELAQFDQPAQDMVLQAYAELLMLEGRHALKHERLDEAWPLLATAAALDPANASPQVELARLLERHGQRNAAVALAHRASRLDPDHAEAKRLLARNAATESARR